MQQQLPRKVVIVVIAAAVVLVAAIIWMVLGNVGSQSTNPEEVGIGKPVLPGGKVSEDTPSPTGK
jgi:hypothetical protein